MIDIFPIFKTLEVVSQHHSDMAKTLSMREQVTLSEFSAMANEAVAANQNRIQQDRINVQKAQLFAFNRNEMVYGVTTDLKSLQNVVPQKSVKAIVFQDNNISVARPSMTVVHSRFANQHAHVTEPVAYEQPVPLPANVIPFDLKRRSTLAA